MTKEKHPNIKSMNRDTQLMCDRWPMGHGGAREDLNTPWPTINIRPHIMHFRRLAFSYTEVIY